MRVRRCLMSIYWFWLHVQRHIYADQRIDMCVCYTAVLLLLNDSRASEIKHFCAGRKLGKMS